MNHTLKWLLDNPQHIQCENNTNSKIPRRPIHGKTTKKAYIGH